MSERSRVPVGIWVVTFLLAQTGAVRWVAGDERPPSAPDLAGFPAAFDDWTRVADDSIAPEVAAELKADRLLSREYRRSTGAEANLFVAWYDSQRRGERQPHSPKVCLPGAGWTPLSADEITLETRAGPITINRYEVGIGKARAVVLYWYQTSRRVLSGEWEAKFWLVADAVRDRRTDVALVRIMSPALRAHESEASATAADLARCVYPVLRAVLP